MPPQGELADRMFYALFQRDRQLELAKWEHTMKTLAQIMGLSSAASDVSIHGAREQMNAIIRGDAFSTRTLIQKARTKLEKLRLERQRLERVASYSAS